MTVCYSFPYSSSDFGVDYWGLRYLDSFPGQPVPVTPDRVRRWSTSVGDVSRGSFVVTPIPPISVRVFG